jgi:hypothetical protein
MKKKTLVLYNISKDQSSKLDSPKNKRATLRKVYKIKRQISVIENKIKMKAYGIVMEP